MIQGFEVDVDYVGRLATVSNGRPRGLIPLDQKLGYVVHYFGGAQNRSLSLLARLQAAARWHTEIGRFGSGLIGAGLMYHAGIGEDGLIGRTRDFRAPLWSAGTTTHNNFWIHVVLPHGGSQRPTQKQLEALDRFIQSGIDNNGIGNRVRVIGHQEASPTDCPGVPLMSEFVRPIRDGKRWVDVDVKIPEADHIVVNVPHVGTFWIIRNMYKRWSMVDEPLHLFGYPLSGMSGNDEDGYQQHFERVRFEWLPGTWSERHDVHIARVGAELARALYGSAYDDKRDQFALMSEHPTETHRRWFEQTGFSVAHGFYRHWQDHGGLEYNGYPISREFEENGRVVQYFERARLEFNPDSGWDAIYHNVSRGRVNAELMELRNQEPVDGRPISLESYIHVSEPVDISARQIVDVCYANGRNPVYTRERIQKIADAIIKYASVFGFRASIVTAQILHETGFFRFGGQVQPDQLNLAGIGADNTGAAGASFPTEDEAVLAVYAHMALYVYGDTDQWPDDLTQYASKAIRRDAVAWAHANVTIPGGVLLGFFKSVERIRDYRNGRHAQTDSVPIGSLDNGYAQSLVRVGNEVIAA